HEAAEGNVVAVAVLQVLVRGAEATLLPQLDGPARAGDAVLELPPREDVLAGELVASDDAAALAHADLGRGVGEEGLTERRARLEDLGGGARGARAFLLGGGQPVRARRLLRDAAERELADHLAGVARRREREVRGALGHESRLLGLPQRAKQPRPRG